MPVLSVLPSVLVLRRVVILVVRVFSDAISSVATLVVLRLLALLDSVVA